MLDWGLLITDRLSVLRILILTRVSLAGILPISELALRLIRELLFRDLGLLMLGLIMPHGIMVILTIRALSRPVLLTCGIFLPGRLLIRLILRCRGLIPYVWMLRILLSPTIDKCALRGSAGRVRRLLRPIRTDRGVI